MPDKIDEIRRALNNLNLGTNKLKVGDVIADLIIENQLLKQRVQDLEDAAT